MPNVRGQRQTQTKAEPKATFVMPTKEEIANLLAQHNPQSLKDVQAQATAITRFIRAFQKVKPSGSVPTEKDIALFLGQFGNKRPTGRFVGAKPAGRVLRKAYGNSVIIKGERRLPDLGPGEGLSNFFATTEEARAHHAKTAKSIPVEEWAGDCAGTTKLETDHGIRRSTLHVWYKKGLVIGIQIGAEKKTYPLAQFMDARPVEGIADVLAIIPQHRVAWMWLVGENEELGGRRPIDVLRDGGVSHVVAAAKEETERR